METFEIPQNKPLINGKYKSKDDIKSAINKVLDQEQIIGRYTDDNWSAIKKLQTVLNNNSIKFELMDADYEGHGEAKNSSLPIKKVYRFKLDIRDKEGKVNSLYLKVTCKFVGKTGTMADMEYEVSYSFF